VPWSPHFYKEIKNMKYWWRNYTRRRLRQSAHIAFLLGNDQHVGLDEVPLSLRKAAKYTEIDALPLEMH
jgi:hypothetical protein